jgi:hypothetical protein
MQTRLAQLTQQAQQMQIALQQGQEQIDKDQKTIARNGAKMKKDLNAFEGERHLKISEGDDNVKITRTQTKTI